MEYYAGIDLGGTNIKCGIVDETGKIVCQESMPTHSEKGFSDVVSTMAELVKNLSKAVSVRVKAVGLLSKWKKLDVRQKKVIMDTIEAFGKTE